MSHETDVDEQLATNRFFQDPYPIYDLLRNEAPVHWSEAWECWLISRYDDVSSTLRDHVRLSNAERVTSFLDQLPPDVQKDIVPLRDHYSVGLLSSDPPAHTRVRSLLNRAFTTRVVEQMRERITQLVDEALAAAAPTGQLDVIADLASPLPATVIAEMLGVPVEQRAQFLRWANAIFGFLGTGHVDPETVYAATETLVQARGWLAELIAQRRANPRDDLFTALTAGGHGEAISDAELLSTCITLLTAGHDTTTSLISSALLTLLRHPEQLAQVREDPALVRCAIEETLRFESPLQRNLRVASGTMALRGQTIVAGDRVEQLLGAANRDPRQFDDAASFDVTREHNRHVAFGQGIHLCIGAPLARLEAPLAVAAVLDRFEGLAIDGEPRWRQNSLARKLEALTVTFNPIPTPTTVAP